MQEHKTITNGFLDSHLNMLLFFNLGFTLALPCAFCNHPLVDFLANPSGFFALKTQRNPFYTLSMIKAAVFDLDGTIADTLGMAVKVFKKAITPYMDHEISEKEIRATFGRNEKGMISVLLKDHRDAALNDYYALYEKSAFMCPRPIAGIPELIDYLKGLGLKVYLVTGKSDVTCGISLRGFGMDKTLDAVYAGSEQADGKTTAMKRLLCEQELRADEAVYIGDAISDVNAANDAGIYCLSAAWCPGCDRNGLMDVNRFNVYDSIPSIQGRLARMVRAYAVKPLFEGFSDTLLPCIFEGHMGEAIECNGSAMISLGEFSYLAGKPSEDMVRQASTETIYPVCDGWAQLIQDVWKDKYVKHQRFAMKMVKEFDVQALEQLVRGLDPEFRLRRFDREICAQAAAEAWSKDFLEAFDDIDDFLQRGFGMAVTFTGRLVAGAASFAISDGKIEIEIDTRPEFRNRGLAKSCGAALILHCISQGIYPSWDAFNERSVRLASHFGYEVDHSYFVFQKV